MSPVEIDPPDPTPDPTPFAPTPPAPGTWFTPQELKNKFPALSLLQSKSSEELHGYIEAATQYVEGAFQTQYDNPPDQLLAIAFRYARNMALGSDENVMIARARGQATFTVAGEAMTIDLSQNPFLDIADREFIEKAQKGLESIVFTDKVVIRAQGNVYQDAVRGADDSEYVRRNGTGPSYLRSRLFTGQ